jgi:hypothetical protein
MSEEIPHQYIYVMGDSHMRPFSEDRPDLFKTPLVISKTAYAVGDIVKNDFTGEAVLRVPSGSRLIISWGEIDCRHYVPQIAAVEGIPIRDVIERIFTSYAVFLRGLNTNFRLVPLGPYLCPDDLNHSNNGVRNSFWDILEAKDWFNKLLCAFCERHDLPFVPIYEIGKKNNWHTSSPGGDIFGDSSHLRGCHLIAPVVDEILKKWPN